MATGFFNTKKLANVSIKDIEIYYSYSPSLETPFSTLIPLNAEDVISTLNNNQNIVNGLYNLRLPSETFNRRGYYNIIIKPKTIKTRILDCGTLSALPNVKGLVIDITSQEWQGEQEKFSNGALSGFKIEYIDEQGNVIPNKFTIVTYSNRCEAISQSVTNTTQKSIAYRLNDSGNLLFLTVTPSTSPAVRPNIKPDIGKPNQDILLTNPYFDAINIELELGLYDLDYLGNIISGEQIRNVETGKVSYFDEERNIIKQMRLFEIKDDITDVPLYEVKENVDTIDESDTFDNVLNDIV